MVLMVVIVGVICCFGIFGPIAEARLTRNDKLIDNNLYSVSTGVNSYVTDNNHLPADLNSLKLTGDAKKLVTDKLVTYKQDTEPVGVSNDYPTYYYQLCVNYAKADTNQSSYSSPSYYAKDDGYSSYLSTYGHGAGNVCYKLKTEAYDSVHPLPIPMKTEN
jgi:hypothetical protein